MVEFFKFENNNFQIKDEHVLLVPEFEALWDSEKDKGKVLNKFKYVFLIADFTVHNPYREYTDDLKKEKALKATSLRSNQIDDFINDAIEAYREIQSSNKILKMIESMYTAMDKLMVYFETVNFTDIVVSGARKGTLLHSPKELMSVVKEAKNYIETLQFLKEKVKEESSGEISSRGNNELGWIK